MDFFKFADNIAKEAELASGSTAARLHLAH